MISHIFFDWLVFRLENTEDVVDGLQLVQQNLFVGSLVQVQAFLKIELVLHSKPLAFVIWLDIDKGVDELEFENIKEVFSNILIQTFFQVLIQCL